MVKIWNNIWNSLLWKNMGVVSSSENAVPQGRWLVFVGKSHQQKWMMGLGVAPWLWNGNGGEHPRSTMATMDVYGRFIWLSMVEKEQVITEGTSPISKLPCLSRASGLSRWFQHWKCCERLDWRGWRRSLLAVEVPRSPFPFDTSRFIPLTGWGSGPPVCLVLHPGIEPGSDAWGMCLTH